MSDNIDELAAKISRIVYPHNNDFRQQAELLVLLIEFAEEIKRGAIEP